MVLSVTSSCAVGVELSPQAQVGPFDSLPRSDVVRPLPGPSPDVLLPADQAFRMSIVVADPQTIAAEFVPAEGYYLYRDKFAFHVREPADVELASVELPRGEVKDDPFFGRVELFHNKVQAVLRLQRASAGPIVLDVAYQGCNDIIGVCYPPIEKRIRLELPAATSGRTRQATEQRARE